MKTEITQQQIKDYAKAIGDRPYHPIGTFIPGVNTGGVTIRQEFMRTAMWSLINSYTAGVIGKEAFAYTDALLYQLAKAELEAEQEVGNV